MGEHLNTSHTSMELLIIEDTIYFAGEAMYRGTAVGTVEAALVSGQQVAHAIVSGRH